MGLMQDTHDDGYRPVTLEAHDLVFGDRQGSYGHPLDDFTCTAAMWSAYLRHKGILAPGDEVTAEDVGPMMMMVKLSRQANAPKTDNMIDAAGYAETTERVIFERARRAREEAALVSSLADRKMARELGLGESDLKFRPCTPVEEANFRASLERRGLPVTDGPMAVPAATPPLFVKPPTDLYRCQAESQGDKL